MPIDSTNYTVIDTQKYISSLDPSYCTLSFVFYNTDVFNSTAGYIMTDGTRSSSSNTNRCGLYINGFVSPSPSNSSFPTVSTTYKNTDCYILPVVHNLSGVDYTNINYELIIKHKANSAAGYMYLCFFLQSSSSTSTTQLDTLISNITKGESTSSSIELNNLISMDKSTAALLYYNDSGNVDPVFVFTTPLKINTDLSTVFNKNVFDKGATSDELSFLFVNSNDDLSIINFSNLTSNNWPNNGSPLTGSAYYLPYQNIAYTINGDQIYMECQPTGVSAEEILAYNVPVDSEYTKNSSELSGMRDMVSLSMFLAALVFFYFVIPPLYKVGVIDNVNKWIIYPKADPDREQFKRIASVDSILILYALLLIIVVTVSQKLRVLYVIILVILGIAIIQYNKLFDDFMMTKISGNMVGSGYPKSDPDKNNIMGYFSGSDFSSFGLESFGYLQKNPSLGGFLILIFIAIVLFGVFSRKDVTPHIDSAVGGVVCAGLVGLMPIVSMMHLYFRFDQTQAEAA